MSSLSPEAYAVIEGRHSDPFRYLGPHVEGDVPLVRIFLPDAEGVAIVDEQGHERSLERIHDAGLFEGRLSNGSRRYRVRARYGERQVEIEDPYRFPPICPISISIFSAKGPTRISTKSSVHIPWSWTRSRASHSRCLHRTPSGSVS
jgi:hypothetical protein